MIIHKNITRTPMGNKRFYVYQYSYPSGFISDEGVDLSDVVFYVGKGTVAKPKAVERIDIHEQLASGSDWDGKWDQTWNVICGIWHRGMDPNKQVVFDTDDEREAFHEERKLILLHRSRYLTNKMLNNPNSTEVSISLSIRDGSPSEKEAALDITRARRRARLHSSPNVKDTKPGTRVSVHVELAGRLREDIRSGKYDAFGFLPSIKEIANLYGASRSAVDNALQLLTGEKLIVPQKGLYQINSK